MSEWTEDTCPDRLAERPYKKIYACKNISTDSGHLQDFFLQKCTVSKMHCRKKQMALAALFIMAAKAIL